eukprot:792041-Pelagomonas_calceolata.AAC.1
MGHFGCVRGCNSPSFRGIQASVHTGGLWGVQKRAQWAPQSSYSAEPLGRQAIALLALGAAHDRKGSPPLQLRAAFCAPIRKLSP